MINEVTLIGNAGSDAEVKQAGQSELATFSLATTESWKKGDEWESKTTWHTIVAWGNTAKQAAKIKKGDQVFIKGKIVVDEWEDDQGNKRKAYKIQALTVRKTGGKNK